MTRRQGLLTAPQAALSLAKCVVGTGSFFLPGEPVVAQLPVVVPAMTSLFFRAALCRRLQIVGLACWRHWLCADRNLFTVYHSVAGAGGEGAAEEPAQG